MKKAKEGIFDLVVRPKGKGIEPAMYASTFSIEPIQGATPAAAAGDPGEEITVFADFLGKQKARVKLGGKKGKVTSWLPEDAPVEGAAGAFSFKIPKKLANGTYDLEVFNKTYSVTFPDFLTVENSTVGTGGGGGGGGGTTFTCKVGGKSFKAVAATRVYASETIGMDVVTEIAPVQAGNPVKVFGFLFRYDPAMGGAAQLSGDDIVGVSYGVGIFPNVDTYIGANDFVIDISGVNGSQQLSGSMSGTLTKILGSGPATLSVTNGSFKLDMVDEL